MFGQSNMEGMGTVEPQDRVSNPRVRVLQDQTCSNLNRQYGTWYTAAPPLNRCWSGLGPGDYFGKIMADSLPAQMTIGLVPASVAGCNIALYQKSAPIGRAGADIPSQFSGGYAWLLDLAKQAQKVGVIRGILFHQGETNTSDPSWKYKVQEIVQDLKKDLSLGDVPFLAGELLYSQYKSCCSSHNVEINKLPGLIPNAHVISANGLPGKDEAHFTSASYREFGIRYAKKMLELSPVQCLPSPTAAFAKLDAGDWSELPAITAESTVTVHLGPHPYEEGLWSWSGCGLSGENREQSLRPQTSCVAVGVYTNPCGEISEVKYTITIPMENTTALNKTSTSSRVVTPPQGNSLQATGYKANGSTQ